MAEPKGFVLYRRQEALLSLLDMTERGELITALFRFFIDGEELHTDNRALQMAYAVISDQIRYDVGVYADKCKKLSDNLKKNKYNCIGQDAIAGESIQTPPIVANTKENTNEKENTKAISKAKAEEKEKETAVRTAKEQVPAASSEREKRGAFYRRRAALTAYGKSANVYLSDEEHEELMTEFPDDLEERIERLSEYIAENGSKYKNHADVIRRWAKSDYPGRYDKPRNTELKNDDFDEDEYYRAALERGERYFERISKKNSSENSTEERLE